MDNLDKVTSFLAAQPLEKLGPVFELLAQRVWEHRKTHGGYVPLEIFTGCVEIGGEYTSFEMVIQVLEGLSIVGYALKKRISPNEKGWAGKYQIPGVTDLLGAGIQVAFQRLSKEIFGAGHESMLQPGDVKYMLPEKHCEENERAAECWTHVYLTRFQRSWITQQEWFVTGNWKIFPASEFGNSEIVGHHRNTLRAIHERSICDSRPEPIVLY